MHGENYSNRQSLRCCCIQSIRCRDRESKIMMDNAWITATSLLLMTMWRAVLGQYVLNLHLSSSKVRQGESISVTCQVTNHLNASIMMSWVRKLGEHETEIARNTELTEDFRKTKRYEVNSRVLTRYTDYEFTLNIKNATAADAGEIGCLLPANNIEIFRPLIVQVPVRSVRLSSRDEANTYAVIYTSDEVVVFDEGAIHRLSCNVSGSYPEPRVRVLVGEEDITQTFERSSTLVKEGPRRNGGTVQFVTDLYYTVQLINERLNIGHGFNRKRILCVAELPDSGLANVSSAITVTLAEFRPKFECNDEIFAELHQQGVELRCRVIGKPQVLKGRFSWKRSTTGNMSIETGSSDGTYTGKLFAKTGDMTAKEMTLKIEHVFPQHFRTYYFEAENEKGVSVKEITLRKDPVGAAQSGTADWRSWHQAICFTVTTIITILSITAMLST